MNTSSDQFDDGTDQVPPSDEIRAGEYVLGVLDADGRRAAQARVESEPLFAALVEAWNVRFSAWLLGVPAVTPGVHVWPRIRTKLGWSSVQTSRPGAWNSVAFWRGATLLATAASVAVIVVGLQSRGPVAPPPAVVMQPAPPAAAPPAVAPPAATPPPPIAGVPPAPVQEEAAARPVTVLARDDGSAGWIATIDAASGKVLMVPVPSPADAEGRVNELWLIPDGQAPLSLGFVSNEKAHTVVMPAAVRQALAVGGTFAVTLEPQQGMPHAAPSGPIVAKGGIQQI